MVNITKLFIRFLLVTVGLFHQVLIHSKNEFASEVSAEYSLDGELLWQNRVGAGDRITCFSLQSWRVITKNTYVGESLQVEALYLVR